MTTGISFVPENEYDLLISSLNVSISKHLLDGHLTVIWANERYYEIFGYTKTEYEQKFHNQCDIYFLSEPKEWKQLCDTIQIALKQGKNKYEHLCRIQHRNGSVLWVKMIGNFIKQKQDGVQVVYTVILDVTEQMQAQVEQSVTYNNLPGYVAKYRVQSDGFSLIDANERFRQIFEVQDSFIPFDTDLETAIQPENYKAMRRGQPVSFITKRKDKDSSKIYWMRVNGECVDWRGSDPVYLLIYIDITDLTEQRNLLQQANEQLQNLAFVDPVTGGYNRNCFERDAGQAVREAPPDTYVLIWMNMQKFKVINDLAGTEQGDKTLKYISDTVLNHLQEGEYVARLSADNFTLLMYNHPKQMMIRRLEEMVDNINRFNKDCKQKYFLSFTMGIYCIHEPNMPMVQIQDRAHVARKLADGTHGTRLCTCMFYSEVDRLAMLQEKKIENRMHDAIKNHEFVVYLQPKLSLDNDAVSGAEALVRWLDPERGLIPPVEFIPLFEKNGFIIDLDHYVFEKVCQMLRKWMNCGKQPIPISVNMSRAHFLHKNFLDWYEITAEKYQVPSKLIEIELTESMALEDANLLENVIQSVHQKGFLCSIDDFGSGYSSLNMLKNVEADTLKLDQGFCASGRIDNPRELAVIRSVVDLAKTLGMSTVAEGVETQPQMQFLKEAKCDKIQGYVFSKPLPIEAFEKLLFGQKVEN